MEEPLIKFNRKSDFEQNLFLRKYIAELKAEIKKLKDDEALKAKDFEIGVLKSEVEEYKHKYELLKNPKQKYKDISGEVYAKLSPKQKKKIRYAMKDEVVSALKEQIATMEEAMKRKNERIEELESQLENK